MRGDDEAIAPAKFFGKGDPLYVQAQQMWGILTGFVMMKSYPVPEQKMRTNFLELIAYSELAELMGRPGSQNMLSRQLGILGHYCVMNDLPPLNIVVVNKISELPGDGAVLRAGRTVKEEMLAVSSFNWFAVRPPTIGALRKVYDQCKAH
ncbi:hypothetical protein [Cereibacter johrii]|uniref:hypothetical protein n=1 Tax=Cereibacter johrii TaxID=445629 RepID=UPI0011BD970B|nr:hypothetical protein [Cereibacter johrii]